MRSDKAHTKKSFKMVTACKNVYKKKHIWIPFVCLLTGTFLQKYFYEDIKYDMYDNLI